MDVLFINAQDALELRKEVNGQLILGTLLLQADFDVDILRFCQVEGFKDDYEVFIHNMIQKILTYEPKAVSFYSLWPDYHIMLRIAKELKAIRPDIYTVFGGPQPSATAQETMESMPYVDFICSGEGENTVVPFFTALLRNNKAGFDTVPGLYYRENNKVIHHDLEHPLCDINATPQWDTKLYLKHYINIHENYHSNKYCMPIDPGRGCPYSCTFCCTSGYWRRTYRLKDPIRIVNDILYYKDSFGIRSFWFSHDAFTSNKKLVEKVCDYLIDNKIDISWKCTARIDCIDDNLILKMKKAGLFHIEFGIESGSSRIQKIINKNLNLNTIKERVKFIISHDIGVGLFFMYGFPEETEHDLTQTINLGMDLLDMGVKQLSMSYCQFNPTTELTNKYRNKLVFDEKCDMPSRDVYGYSHEIVTIRNNRDIFPYYFTVKTELREKYQYLGALLYIYQIFPNSIKAVREIYTTNILDFYNDFKKQNMQYLNNIYDLAYIVRANPLLLVMNILAERNSDNMQQIKGLLEFDYDLQCIKKSSNDIQLQKVYDFNYIDFLKKTPYNLYSRGISSELVIIKTNNTIQIKIINIKAHDPKLT